MFYSHEILTSRKYGIATVWLVATLGSKSKIKHISRKQIIDVDVEKACETIINPVAPIALRLQGNLLYGLSQVLLQQSGYVLSDANMINNNMRIMLSTVKNAALNSDARKARPEQLMLQDDPSFLPDLMVPPYNLLLNLELLDLNDLRQNESQTLTPFGSQQTESSHGSPLGGLILPTSSPHRPGEFQLEGGDQAAGNLGGTSEIGDLGDLGDMLEPDFTFGDDGNLIELDPQNTRIKQSTNPGTVSNSVDGDAIARVRKEHEDAKRAKAQISIAPLDLDLPIYDNELPDGEAFSPVIQRSIEAHSDIPNSSSAVTMPMYRKPRSRRALQADVATELQNNDLTDWNNNYLQNMANVTQQKNKGRAPQTAKANAEHMVWGAGIGGIGDQIMGASSAHPLAMFAGDSLFKLITGVDRKAATGSKHSRDSGIDEETQKEARRVRQRTHELEEVARGVEDEGFFMPDDQEVELPREAASALNDQDAFSTMPWNASASARGSSAVPHSGQVGTFRSGGQTHRSSRLVSASPLFGRGQAGGLEPFHTFESEGIEDFGEEKFLLPEPSSSLPQDAEISTATFRVREALSAEGENFLSFINGAILKKRNLAQINLGDMDDELHTNGVNEVTFEELLPPHVNTKTVACQGLVMTLALGMKGMLNIEQKEHHGEILLQVNDKAKEQAAQFSNLKEQGHNYETGEVKDKVVAQASRIEHEQEIGNTCLTEDFAATTAVPEDDDHDSLYDD